MRAIVERILRDLTIGPLFGHPVEVLVSEIGLATAVTLVMTLPDNDNPGKTVKFRSNAVIDYTILHDNPEAIEHLVLVKIHHAVLTLVTHEADESIRYKGKQPYDPHNRPDRIITLDDPERQCPTDGYLFRPSEKLMEKLMDTIRHQGYLSQRTMLLPDLRSVADEIADNLPKPYNPPD